MGQGILLSQEANVDFMIHGVFSYELFGQTVWITTTHVCVLIVMLIIAGFCIAANRAVKHATEDCGNAVRNDRRCYGKTGRQVPELYWDDFYFYSDQQYLRAFRPPTAYCGLWSDFCTGNHYIHADTL